MFSVAEHELSLVAFKVMFMHLHKIILKINNVHMLLHGLSTYKHV